jgi:hypothetical protein
MKAIKINIKLLSFLAAFLMLFTACDDDESVGGYTSTSLETLIVQAESLISSSVEGTSAGDYQPGSIEILENVVTWVNWKIENAESQDDLDDAATKLEACINTFLESTVAVAMPWIQQEDGTGISISDDIKTLFNTSFTIETQIYIVDLTPLSYSNNVFATEQDGPDSGFVIRYFADGSIDLNVGTDDGWTNVVTDAGVMKSGEWMQIAFVNEITSQKLYVNGVEVSSQTATYIPGEDKSFVLGNGPTWTSRAVNAILKDVRVWSDVRTDSEIADNKTATMVGTEDGLECYFPLGSDLGSEFDDITGNYTATLNGEIEWVSEVPVIVLDKTDLQAAIVTLEDFQLSIDEGDEDGDYPVGTSAYIDELLVSANDALENGTLQSTLDDMTESITANITLINSMLVEDTDGIFIDIDDDDAIGFSITPNYTPTGDYTVEFNVKVKSLFGYANGEFFNNGTFGIWVYGYEELTEENVLGAGGLWNFTDAGDGWQGPKADALSMSTGVWQHVAIVHDNTASTTTLYVDGLAKGVQEEIGAPSESGWDQMWLGNGWGKMDGYLKDFRLWDVARDAADLDADITGTEADLQIYFPLDRVNGVKFSDETGNYQGEMSGISWNL